MESARAAVLRRAAALASGLASILLGYGLLGQVVMIGLIYAGALGPIPIGTGWRDLAFRMSHSWGWIALLVGWSALAVASAVLSVGLVRRDPARHRRNTLAGMVARLAFIGLLGALGAASVVASVLLLGRLAYWWT